MTSKIPTFNDTFMKAMSSSSVPYPDFTATYEMSLSSIFFDFPQKPNDLNEASEICDMTGRKLFDASDPPTTLHKVHIYSTIIDRCFSCIKDLTDTLNLSALEIRDCWLRSSRLEGECDEKDGKLQEVESTIQIQKDRLKIIAKAFKKGRDKHLKHIQQGKDNYFLITGLQEKLAELEKAHRNCEMRFEAFNGILQVNEDIEGHLRTLQEENAKLVAENYTYEIAAPPEYRSPSPDSRPIVFGPGYSRAGVVNPARRNKRNSRKLNFRYERRNTYSLSGQYPGNPVDSVSASPSRARSSSEPSQEMVKEASVGGYTEAKHRSHKRKWTGLRKRKLRKLGTLKELSGEISEGFSAEMEKVASSVPGEIRKKTSQCTKEVLNDAQEAPQEIPGTSKVGPVALQEVLNIPGIIDQMPGNAPKDTTKKDMRTAKFDTALRPVSRCIKLTMLPSATTTGDLCRIVRGGRLEFIHVNPDSTSGYREALIYFFSEKAALDFHSWVLEPPRLVINGVEIEPEIIQVRAAAPRTVAEESRVIHVPIPVGVDRHNAILHMYKIGKKLEIAIALQAVTIRTDKDGKAWAEYSFERRDQAKKILTNIIATRWSAEGARYGKDECEAPLIYDPAAKSWEIVGAEAEEQGEDEE